MRLKTFKAPDLATALSRARAEMGADALVLATNEIPGRLGLTQVEITVGCDEPLDATAGHRLQQLSTEMRQVQQSLGSQAKGASKLLDRTDEAVAGASVDETELLLAAALRERREEPLEKPAPKPTGVDSRLRSAADALSLAGLSRDLVERFARIAARDLEPRSDADAIAAATERGIAALIPFLASPLRSRVLFLVGPPGSGKTTSLAKLAARITLDGGRRVVVCQADAERIGALEQAEIFCRHIGAELERIDTPEDLRRIIDAADEKTCILVDTAGVGGSDQVRLEELSALRDVAPRADVALLIPAGLHQEQAAEILERFRGIDPTCVALSKIDDGGRRVGDLLTALAPHELPLAFVTNGHRVPHDLESATPRRLAAMMLRFARDAERQQEISE